MSSLRSNIFQIRKRLERRLKMATEPEITVRDFVSYQYNLALNLNKLEEATASVMPAGEFYHDRLCTEEKRLDEKAASTESDDALIKRMVDYIKSLADIAASDHLKENFDGAQIKETKKNSLTRLLLHEFALYPNRHRGSLSVDSFHHLLQQLEAMAEQFPPNLQLILGTVPIHVLKTPETKTADDATLHNMAVIIDCGKPAKIHTFAKAFPSDVDPVYQDSKAQNAVNTFLIQENFNEKINRLVSQILSDTGQVQLNNVTDLITFCDTYFVNLDQHAPCLKEKLQLLAEKVKDKTYPLYSQEDHIDDAIDIGAYAKQLSDHFFSATAKEPLPFPQLANGTQTGINIIYGGNIICKTHGGVTYRLACDICFDHSQNLAQNSTLEHLQHARHHAEDTLPTKATHVVLSNTADTIESNFICTTRTHVDPVNSALLKSITTGTDKTQEPEFVIEIPTPIFGSHTVIHTFPPRKLNAHTNGLDKSITKHNQFMTQLDALRICRTQLHSPQEISQVDQMIRILLQRNQHSTLRSTLFKPIQSQQSMDDIIAETKTFRIR